MASFQETREVRWKNSVKSFSLLLEIGKLYFRAYFGQSTTYNFVQNYPKLSSAFVWTIVRTRMQRSDVLL